MTVPTAQARVGTVLVSRAGEVFSSALMEAKFFEAYNRNHVRAFVSGRIVNGARALTAQLHRAEPRGRQKAERPLASTGASGS